MMAHLPAVLILLRLVAGLLFLPLVWYDAPSWTFVTLLTAGFVGDIADGMIARRLRIDSLELRRMDTNADMLFYTGAVVAVLVMTPGLFWDWLPWLCAYGALFIARNAVDFFRYHASPSYHMWSGKIWSILLFAVLFACFLGNQSPVLFIVAFAIYTINAVEGITASILLPRPCKDVPSVWHAIALRKRLD